MNDYETCSWCTEEVPYSSLREHEDGAMVCRKCQKTPEFKPYSKAREQQRTRGGW